VTDPQTPYDLIGGEDGVRRLVDAFYDAMDRRPDAADVRALHPESLRGSREKLFWWFSGWLGGPQLYVERKGHPRLRMRHFPYAITAAGAEAWMGCMREALAETVADAELRAMLDERLHGLAHHMVNRA
jgi:hemoglobin